MARNHPRPDGLGTALALWAKPPFLRDRRIDACGGLLKRYDD